MENLSPCHNATIGRIYPGKCDVCAKPVESVVANSMEENTQASAPAEAPVESSTPATPETETVATPEATPEASAEGEAAPAESTEASAA